MPISYDYPVLSLLSGSKKLNKNTPTDTTNPTTILFPPSFKLFSLTRVHRIATKSTDNKLHDLNAITTGKLVLATAQVYVILDTKTTMAQYRLFF